MQDEISTAVKQLTDAIENKPRLEVSFKFNVDSLNEIQDFIQAETNASMLCDILDWRRQLYKGWDNKENWTSEEIINKIDDLLELFRR